MLAFRARAALEFEPTRISAPPPRRKERLAIVASGGKPCGIASYAAALTCQLADAFDVTLFSLDQYLMRNTHRRVRPRADREIHEIARAIAGFDAVNLQLEHGTLGGHGIDIYRRFCWIAAAAPRLSVTFHTLLKPVPTNLGGFGRALLTLDFATAGRIRRDFRRNRLLSVGIPRQLRQLQRHKHVSAVVHNRRDLYDAKYLYGLDNVFDHPLSFLNADEIDRVRADGAHHRFPIAERLPPDAVLVGVFGFLNEYKGFGTAIRALHHLPKNYHLLIFGGTHPNEIAARRPVHPYIASLFEDAFTDTSLYDRLRASGESIRPGLVLNADRSLGELLGTHPRDLSTRIHFMGALGDADFLAGMTACDAVVFPYQEVGQSSSGPISQALELGCRILAARTHAFLGFGEYHKQAVEFFDIGNHLELADRLRAPRQFPGRTGLPEYNVETNKAVYLVANSALTRRPAPLPLGDTRAEAELQQS
jgi:glycosyltransferase involved in cell wall biosynthesis